MLRHPIRLKGKISNSWAWIYGLSFLFALGILYTVFLYVFEGHLVPTIKNITDTTITDPVAKADIYAGIDKYMVYFKLMPFILFFIVVIYMFATTLYKQSGGQYM
jgi:hypothetical protein